MASAFVSGGQNLHVLDRSAQTGVDFVFKMFPPGTQALEYRMAWGMMFNEGLVLQSMVTCISRRIIIDVLSVFQVEIRAVLFIASVPGAHADNFVVLFPVCHRDDGRVYHDYATAIGNVFFKVLAYGFCPCGSAVVDDDQVILAEVRFECADVPSKIGSECKIHFEHTAVFKYLLHGFAGAFPIMAAILSGYHHGLDYFLGLCLHRGKYPFENEESYDENDFCFHLLEDLKFLFVGFHSIRSWQRTVCRLYPRSSTLNFPSLK